MTCVTVRAPLALTVFAFLHQLLELGHLHAIPRKLKAALKNLQAACKAFPRIAHRHPVFIDGRLKNRDLGRNLLLERLGIIEFGFRYVVLPDSVLSLPRFSIILSLPTYAWPSLNQPFYRLI